MTVSRTRTVLPATALALGLFTATAICAPAALAQSSGQPLRLFPLPGQGGNQGASQENRPSAERQPSQTPQTLPGTLPGAATDRSAPAPGQIAPGQIAPASPVRPVPAAPAQTDSAPSLRVPMPVPVSSNVLAAPSLDSLGIAERGFGQDIWNGTPRAVAQRLLESLPELPGSHTLYTLQRRLLVSAALLPPPGPEEGPEGTVLTIRAQALREMGALDDLSALLASLPRNAGSEGLSRLSLQTDLLRGKDDAACATARNAGSTYGGVFWRRAQIVCDALARETGRVDLDMTVLREMNVPEDRAFTRLVDAVMGHSVVLDSLPAPTALHLALLKAANMPVPADAVAGAPPTALVALAEGDYAAAEISIAAAERGLALGIVSADRLAALYTAYPATPAQLAGAIAAAEKRSDSASRAHLFRLASEESLPLAKAEAIATALRIARDDGSYMATARLYAGLIAGMQPTGEMIWFAEPAAHALYAANRPEDARPWLLAIRDRGRFDELAAAAWLRLWPLARLVGDDTVTVWEDMALEASLNALMTAQPNEGPARAALLAALLDAAGEPVPSTLWRGWLDGPYIQATALPSPTIWFALENAAAEARIGETLSLVLIAAGSDPLGQIDIVPLRRVIQALRQADQPEAARQLALEAAIAHGF
jgi:hypothetical protein